MSSGFLKPISQKILSAANTFKTFPTTIGSALAFTIVTIIRINLDWQQQLPYNFLFNCLHWSLGLGAVFSLAAITASRSRHEGEKAFRIANIVSVAVIALTFLLLYYLSANYDSYVGSGYANVSGIAAARVSAAIFISMIAFIVLAAYPKEQSDFARSLFMTQKAFFIALLYGGVLMAGTSAVAGAFQALIYKEMSYKVYQYLGAIVGFFAFAIFIGYFPDFSKDKTDQKREIAQRQPRFVEILFEYIMIPIMFALTVVLLAWSAMKIFSGNEVVFEQLASISTSFAIGGIWLHMMVSDAESGMAKFYKKAYPFAALLILAFEAWALILQLSKYGLKDVEYMFTLLWIVAVISLVLLLIVNKKAHKIIAVAICAAAAFSVLPFVGYNELPVTWQAARLENLLTSQGMLQNGKITPAASTPDQSVRENITDAVLYLAYASDAKLPEWFDKDLANSDIFKQKLGFNQTVDGIDNQPDKYTSTNLILKTGAINISGYQWAIYPQQMIGDSSKGMTAGITGEAGDYTITWMPEQTNQLPQITVKLGDEIILQKDMGEYIDGILAKYPPQLAYVNATLDDMSVKFETSKVSVMIVFFNVGVNTDTQQNTRNYSFGINGIYLKEK